MPYIDRMDLAYAAADGRVLSVERVVDAMNGMAAELEVFGVVTSGAESDLEAVTRIARSMVGRWGMSDAIGPVAVTIIIVIITVAIVL